VVRWYLPFPISDRDLEHMLADRGVQVDHTTLFRWIQAYAPELRKRVRSHLRMRNDSWRVDETYLRVKGQWVYLYPAVEAAGQTIDFPLSPSRDTAAARRFFILSHPVSDDYTERKSHLLRNFDIFDFGLNGVRTA
jgi:transposase-like protein